FRFHTCQAGLIVLAYCLAAPGQPPAAQRSEPSVPVYRKTMEQRLDEERTRIRQIAEPVLERIRKLRSPEMEPNIVAQTIKVQSADASYHNAKLSREVSEIAVKEYEEGIYLQDVATAEGQARLAESDVKRSGQDIANSK